MKMAKVQIFVPCYKRVEYIEYTLNNLKNTKYEDCQFWLVDDGSKDERIESLFNKFKEHRLNTLISIHKENKGLRFRILEFFKEATAEYLCKVDNDCIYSENWLSELVRIIEESNFLVLAPNEKGKNPAKRLGTYDEKTECYIARRPVGGHWLMKREVLEIVKFSECNCSYGIVGAWNLIVDIKKQCGRMAWTDKVEFEHIGTWDEDHKLSIANDEYDNYVKEIGRGEKFKRTRKRG